MVFENIRQREILVSRVYSYGQISPFIEETYFGFWILHGHQVEIIALSQFQIRSRDFCFPVLVKAALFEVNFDAFIELVQKRGQNCLSQLRQYLPDGQRQPGFFGLHVILHQKLLGFGGQVSHSGLLRVRFIALLL